MKKLYLQLYLFFLRIRYRSKIISGKEFSEKSYYIYTKLNKKQ